MKDPNGTGYAAINNFPQIYDLVLQNNSLYNNVRGDYKNCTSTTDIYVNPFASQKNHDYRLLSVAGRWDGKKWVEDKASSPFIAAGYPYSDNSDEPEHIVVRIAPAKSILPIVNETQITTNVSYKEFPSIYGDRIVWQDYRNGYLGNASWDIYMYDITTSKEIRITTNESWQENPEIFGDRIVWEDGRNGNRDIYMYNISTRTETQITDDELDNTHPAIYGDKIVWEERRDAGNHDICMYSISARKEIRIINGESDNIHPAIYGDRVVWERHDGENHDVFMYTISTCKVTQITKNGKACNPAIYVDRIVWEDHRLADEYDLSSSDIYKYDLSSSDIYKYDLSTNRETQVSTSGRAHNSAIYGDRIVWYDFRNGNDDIYMYNMSTSREIQITTNMSEQEFPAIFGDRVVWQDYRNVPYNPDVYMGSISYPYMAAF
jgi:beta propeller repeat protein